MQPCEQADNIKHISKRVDTLCDYTGMNPMTNGKSLRGQIEAVNVKLQMLARRMLLVGVVVASVVGTLVAASSWASRKDAETVKEAAQQINDIAVAVRDGAATIK
jgi:hypothetical protein